MPIDMSDVLSDPAFHSLVGDLFRIVRTASIDDDGVAVNAETAPDAFVGMVAGVPGDMLNRLPEAAQANGSVLVITTTPLSVGTNGGDDADIVVAAGKRYTVTHVENYGMWGSGFVSAVCVPQGVR